MWKYEKYNRKLNYLQVYSSERRNKMYDKYAVLRDARGLTDYKVAKATGITKSTFSEWRAGRYKPKLEKIKKLADYFGVKIEYFLEE